jgi:hypothetical protein
MVEDFYYHGEKETGVVHQLPTVVPGPSFGNAIEQVGARRTQILSHSPPKRLAAVW